MAFDVSWIYQIVDKYTGPLKKIKKITDIANKAFKGSSKALKSMSDKMAGLKGAIASVVGLSTIAFPAKKAMDFEDVMIDLKKVVDFKTPDQFEKFREGIFKTAVGLGKMPEAIGQIAVEGGKLGILPEKLQGFIDLVAKTSVAFDMVEAKAAETIGSIQAKMGLSVQATNEMMDAVNSLADGTSTSGKRVLEVIQRTTGTMKTIKMPPELVAGWAAFADQLEVSPELAASGLNMMVSRMMKMPGMMRKMLKDPNQAIKKFLGRFEKMSEVSRSRRIMKLFGDEAGRFVLKAVASGELFDKTMAIVGDKTKFAGSMARELEKKMGAASTSIGKIKAVANVAMIQIGDGLLPIIKDLTPTIVEVVSSIRMFIKNNPEIVKMGILIGVVVAALTAASVVLGALASGASVLFAILAAITSPIGIIVVGLIGLVLIGKKVYENWDKIVLSLKGAWEWFSKLLDNPLIAAAASVFAPFLAIPALIIKHWEPIKEFFGDIASFISETFTDFMNFSAKVDRFFGFGSGAGDKSAANAAMKAQLNGRIEVAASKGSEVRNAEFDHSASGNVGLNMAGGL
jgi:TP901 family phage tail tape measure protein